MRSIVGSLAISHTTFGGFVIDTALPKTKFETQSKYCAPRRHIPEYISVIL